MNLFLLLTLSSLSLIVTAQSPDLPTIDKSTSNTDNTPLSHEQINHQQNIDQILLELEEEKESELELSQLDSWIAHQLNNSKRVREFSPTQSFIIHLQSDEFYQYRWDLSIPNSKQRDYHLELNVYTHQDGTAISFNHDPQEDSYITVEVRQNTHDNYRELGKVYVTRTFIVNFQSEAQLVRFKNYNAHPILLQINMERPLQHVEHVKNSIALDKQFQLSAEKINTIFEQAKQTDKERNQMYKWQWGFLEREERYESDMLKLTGFELFAILVTAIVQMYCIKALLDNKQIV